MRWGGNGLAFWRRGRENWFPETVCRSSGSAQRRENRFFLVDVGRLAQAWQLDASK